MGIELYKCTVCGQVIAVIKDTGNPVRCCGKPMEHLVPCTTDGAFEKHIPVYTIEDGVIKVTVGEIEHPMLADHYIEWIGVMTKNGVFMKKDLMPGMRPKATFPLLNGDEVEAVYAYCNLHESWKA